MGFNELEHLTPERIIAYRDGEQEFPTFERHLATCRVCRKRLDAARRVAGLVKSTGLLNEFISSLTSLTDVQDRGVPLAVSRVFLKAKSRRHVPAPDLQSVSIGKLLLDLGPTGNPPAHLLQPVDARQFLTHAGETGRGERVAYLRTMQPSGAVNLEIVDRHIRIAGAAQASSSGVALELSLASADGANPIDGTDLTLLSPELPPETVTTDNFGRADIVVPFGHSLLMIYAGPVLHLAIEVQA